MKTLKRTTNYGTKIYSVPKSTQELIPIQKVYPDGIFLVDGRYSKTFQFDDINYTELTDEKKEERRKMYSTMLNSIDKGISAKISIFCKPINQEDFQDTMLMKIKGDSNDIHRAEFNTILIDQLSDSNGMIKESYLTLTVQKSSYEDAKSFFLRTGSVLGDHFKKLGSSIVPINLNQRLRIFHEIYRGSGNFRYDYESFKKAGQSFKDGVAPISFEKNDKYLKFEDKYCSTLFLNTYPNMLDDEMISDISEINRPMIFTIDFVPIPIAEAIKEAESRNFNANTKIVKFSQKQHQNKNFSMMIPFNLQEEESSSQEVWKELRSKDENLYITTVTVAHFAESLTELNKDTEDIITKGDSKSCEFLVLTKQQIHGLNTALPYGPRYISAERSLITSSLSGLCPFTAQEIYQPGGVWYGQNARTRRLIIGNRGNLLNGNCMLLGVSGGGKSFFVKEEAIQLALNSDCDIIFVDPDNDFQRLTRELGGEIIKLSPSSSTHINPLDLDKEYSDQPIKDKADFVFSLCEILSDKHIDSKEKSIIDRCVKNIYRTYLKSDYQGIVPTLKDLRTNLNEQKEPEAKALALILELFSDGSLDTFARQTNVDTNSRIIDYDLSELGNHMMGIGMFILIESIYTRVIKNRAKGRYTYIFIDEIISFFDHQYSAEHFEKLWQRIRKYGGFITGITQNVNKLIKNEKACTMLLNSEFVVMLYQAQIDRQLLAEQFSLSEAQVSAISDSSEGHGLIKFGKTLVPFVNTFPKNNSLYGLITTKVKEAVELNEE